MDPSEYFAALFAVVEADHIFEVPDDLVCPTPAIPRALFALPALVSQRTGTAGDSTSVQSTTSTMSMVDLR